MKLKEILSEIPISVLGAFALYLLDPFNYGYLFGYITLGMVISKKSFLLANLDSNFILLFLFSFTYAVFYSFDLTLGTQYILIYMLFPCGFYLIGKYFVHQVKSSNKIHYLLFLTGLIFSLTTLVSVLINIYSKGFVQIDRNIPVFWDGHVIPATNMSALLTLNMCIPALLVVSYKRYSLFLKIFSIALFVLSAICVLRLGSRTQLGITLLTLIATVIYLFTKQSPVKNALMFLGLFGIINVIFSYFTLDKDSDVLSAYASRMDSKEYGAATAGGRTERWMKSLENLVQEPLGWSVEEFGFSHNLWFDVARVGSVIAFALLIIYTAKALVQIKKSIALDKKAIPLNTMFLVYGMSFFLLFMVEPIFDGYFVVFVFFCFFMGVVTKYYQKFGPILKNKTKSLI